MKSFDLLRVQGYVVLPCRPFIGGANISSSGSQAATALWYSKDSFAVLPAVRVAGDLGALSESPESGKCHCPLGGCAAMTQVDASGVWDPDPKGEPGPQGPAGPQGA